MPEKRRRKIIGKYGSFCSSVVLREVDGAEKVVEERGDESEEQVGTPKKVKWVTEVKWSTDGTRW